MNAEIGVRWQGRMFDMGDFQAFINSVSPYPQYNLIIINYGYRRMYRSSLRYAYGSYDVFPFL